MDVNFGVNYVFCALCRILFVLALFPVLAGVLGLPWCLGGSMIWMFWGLLWCWVGFVLVVCIGFLFVFVGLAAR